MTLWQQFFFPLFLGCLSGVLVNSAALLRMFLLPGSSPFVLGGIALVFGFLVTVLFGTYRGLGYLLEEIHLPRSKHREIAGLLRGIQSFLLSWSGFPVGVEGAAIEVTHWGLAAQRSRTANWSEQTRRSDVSMAIAGGIAAAFHAPLAGLLIVLEMGLGGRMVSVALASLGGFVVSQAIEQHLGVPWFDVVAALYGFKAVHLSVWGLTVVIGLSVGLVASGLLASAKSTRLTFTQLKSENRGFAYVLGAVLIAGSVAMVPQLLSQGQVLLETVLLGNKGLDTVGLIFCAQILIVLVFWAISGTVGAFWPVLVIGGMFGVLLDRWVFFPWSNTIEGFTGAAGLIAGASMLAGFFGIPITASVLVFEVSQNTSVLIPALLASVLADMLRKSLKQRTFAEACLEESGVRLVGGRVAHVLEGISVREAMVSDFERAGESETVAELQERLARGKYPFVPVVQAGGKYLGILTVDTIDEAVTSSETAAGEGGGNHLAQLIEAKDLLYRSARRVPTVRAEENLKTASQKLKDYPCAAVTDQGDQVVGLLFVHQIRLVYDRELARQALAKRWGRG